MTSLPDSIRTVELFMERFVSRSSVPEWILRNTRVDSYHDLNSQAMVFELYKHILYLEQEDGRLEVPATWWDHFKIRWFPERLLRRFPPRHRVYRARMYFPDLPIPSYGSSVHVAVFKEGVVGATLAHRARDVV